MSERVARDLLQGDGAQDNAAASHVQLRTTDCDVRFSVLLNDGRFRRGPSRFGNAIGRDDLVAIVNPANPVSRMSVEQLRKIVAGDVANSSAVGGRSQPIVVYVAADATDEARAIAARLMNGVSAGKAVVRVASSADAVRAVVAANGANAIGLVAFSAAVTGKVVTPQDYPAPSVLSIGERRYPLSVVTTVASPDAAQNTSISSLLTYAGSGEAKAIAERDGIIPPTSKQMRRIRALLTVLVLAIAVVPVSAATRNMIVFGAVVSLTGSTSNEGNLTREGYDFWAAYVNAHGGLRVGNQTYNVEIRYADDGSSPPQTAARLENLIAQDHIDFVLGPYGSGPTFTAAAVAERHAIPMVDSGGAAENIFNQGYRYTVNVMSPARKYLVGIIEYAMRRNPRPKTVAISAASDAFSLEVQQGAVQSANDHGIRVVYADHYAGDEASIAAAAAAIKAADPDIVLNAGHVQDAMLMHRALKDQHVRAKIYGYTNGPDVPAFRATLGGDAEDVLGSAQWSPAVSYVGEPGFYRTSRQYAAAFMARMGHAPDYHNAEATAAGLAFQYALQRAGTTNREAVRDALAHLDVVTFFGLLKFDSRGVNPFKPMVVNQIQHANLVTIYPYRLANATPVYPAPPWAY